VRLNVQVIEFNKHGKFFKAPHILLNTQFNKTEKNYYTLLINKLLRVLWPGCFDLKQIYFKPNSKQNNFRGLL